MNEGRGPSDELYDVSNVGTTGKRVYFLKNAAIITNTKNMPLLVFFQAVRVTYREGDRYM